MNESKNTKINGFNEHNLYRQDAIDSYFSKDFGKSQLLPSRHYYKLVMILIIWLFSAFVFVYTKPIYDTVQIQGWVENHTTTQKIVNYEQGSLVENVFVEQGEIVSKGQIIAKLIRPTGLSFSESKLAQQFKLLDEQHEKQIRVLEQEKKQIELAIEGLKTEQLYIEHNLALTTQHAKRVKNLDATTLLVHQSVETMFENGQLSLQDLSTSQQQLQNIQQKNFNLTSKKNELVSRSRQINHQLLQEAAKFQKLEASIQLTHLKSQARLEEFKQSLNLNIYSPTDGIIENLNVSKGSSLSHNHIIANVRPQNTEYLIKLAIPSNVINHIEPEQEVKIQVDGYPFQQYGSLLASFQHIEHTLMFPKSLSDKPLALTRPVYLARLKIIDKNNFKLLSGVTVSATVGMKQMTILDWILQPITKSLFQNFELEA